MKLIKFLIFILLVCSVYGTTNPTSTGYFRAIVGSNTALTPAAYPTRISGGTPVAIVPGITGCTDVVVVDDIGITDNSLAGWTLSITQVTGGSVLTNPVDFTTIAYTLEIGGVIGTLPANLVLSPTVGTALTFTANVALISPTGVADYYETTGYSFDLLMTITVAATVGKLPGDYAETLSLSLSSDD